MRNKKIFLGYFTLAKREIKRFMRIWSQTLLPPLITTSLYFLVFGKFLGTNIILAKEYSYIEYIVPGLIMLSVINNSYSNTVFSFFSSKFQRSIEEILMSPMSNFSIVMGFITGGIIRGLICGILIAVISIFFTKLHYSNLFLMLFIILLTSTLFASVGLTNGIFAKKFDDTSYILTFFITPLSYLGGVFYSSDMLPVIWQKITLLNPIFYIISIFKYATLGAKEPILNINISILMIVMLTFISIFFNLYLLKRGAGVRK